MLEAALAGRHGFGGAHGVGHVAIQGQAYLFGLGGDGKISVARYQRLHLDEVDAARFELVDGLAAVLRRGNGHRCLVGRLWPVEHRPAHHQARAQQPVRGYIGPRLQHRFKLAAHVADAGDAVGHEQGQNQVGAGGRRAVEIHVGVHVPQPRNEVLAGGINHPARWWLAGRTAHLRNAFAGHHHRHVGLDFAGGHVDHVGVHDGELLGLRGTDGKNESRGNQKFINSHQTGGMALNERRSGR